MDPSNILGSVTGMVAVVLVFAVPILGILATLVIVSLAINRSHKERMKMIEQGMVPALPKRRTGNFHALIITGSILFAFGLALFISEVASRSNDIEGGLIFGLVGLALVVVYAYLRIVRKKEGPPPDRPASS